MEGGREGCLKKDYSVYSFDNVDNCGHHLIAHPLDLRQDYECVEDGLPPLGQAVQVRWPDGVLYDATFRGSNSQDMYTVGAATLAALSARGSALSSFLPGVCSRFYTEI